MITPWGKSQGHQILGDGITFYHTAGHGGIHVLSKQNMQIPEYMRNNDGWYEEDCEQAKVAVCFPSCFVTAKTTLEQVMTVAMATLRDWFPEAYEHYTGLQLGAGESFKRDEQLFREKTKTCMVVMSVINSMDHKDMVRCFAVRGGRNANGCYASLDAATYLIPAREYEQRDRFGYIVDESTYKPVKVEH